METTAPTLTTDRECGLCVDDIQERQKWTKGNEKLRTAAAAKKGVAGARKQETNVIIYMAVIPPANVQLILLAFLSPFLVLTVYNTGCLSTHFGSPPQCTSCSSRLAHCHSCLANRVITIDNIAPAKACNELLCGKTCGLFYNLWGCGWLSANGNNRCGDCGGSPCTTTSELEMGNCAMVRTDRDRAVFSPQWFLFSCVSSGLHSLVPSDMIGDHKHMCGH